jgi:hypothetical protein
MSYVTIPAPADSLTLVLDDGTRLSGSRAALSEITIVKLLLSGDAARTEVRLTELSAENARLVMICAQQEEFPELTHERALSFIREVHALGLGELLYSESRDVRDMLAMPPPEFLAGLSLRDFELVFDVFDDSHGEGWGTSVRLYARAYAELFMAAPTPPSLGAAITCARYLHQLLELDLLLDVVFGWCKRRAASDDDEDEANGRLLLEHANAYFDFERLEARDFLARDTGGSCCLNEFVLRNARVLALARGLDRDEGHEGSPLRDADSAAPGACEHVAPGTSRRCDEPRLGTRCGRASCARHMRPYQHEARSPGFHEPCACGRGLIRTNLLADGGLACVRCVREGPTRAPKRARLE